MNEPDTTPPIVHILSDTGGPPARTPVNSITLHGVAQDAGPGQSGLATVQAFNDRIGWASDPINCDAAPTCDWSFTFPLPLYGAYLLRVEARDVAGNVGHVQHGLTRFDPDGGNPFFRGVLRGAR